MAGPLDGEPFRSLAVLMVEGLDDWPSKWLRSLTAEVSNRQTSGSLALQTARRPDGWQSLRPAFQTAG